MISARTLVLSSVALGALASQAHAAGFYLQEQAARGTGRAYSGEVADQGPASLWWNPSAIASSPREAHIGASAIFVDSEVNNTGSTITFPGGLKFPVSGEPFAYNPINDGVTPNFGVSMPVADRFAVGLSVAAPYNFTTEYRRPAWARYDGLKSSLTTVDIQLTGAMKVTDWLDVGLGFDSQYTDAKLQTASPNLSPLLPDGIQQLRGNGWNYGWTIGAQAHFDRVTLGASYRSAMDHDLDGRVFVGGLLGPIAAGNADTSGSASFTTPWIATAGARWRVTDQLTLDAQVQHFGWSEFDAIHVTTAGGNQTLAQNYKDTTSGGVGADYAVNDRLTLRAGVQFDPTPTPDDERTARVPDGDRWLYGVGATGKIGERTQVDAAFAYIDFANSDVRHDTVFYGGTPAAVTTALRGTVQGTGYVMSVALRTRF
ncbi:MAG TPA: outer membrane protein transport protein [Phenylobacterium sp.]|nr:outer membrane protein transport protein [Phenylobacterium sp.]